MRDESNRWADADEHREPNGNIDWTRIILCLVQVAIAAVFFWLFFNTDFLLPSIDREKKVDTVYIEVPVEKVVPERVVIEKPTTTPAVSQNQKRTEAEVTTKVAAKKVEEKAAVEAFSVPEPVVAERNEKVTEDDGRVFDIVEQMPSFPGGPSALMRFLSGNVRYPVEAKENGVQGRVVVSFVVDRDGSITDTRVARSVDPSLDREALRVVESMPKWTPGRQSGKAVRVKYTVPVAFRLP